MADLFAQSQLTVFQLPELAVGATPHNDTYKSFYLNELVALEASAKRCLTPTRYLRPLGRDGSISLPDIILDISSFYLFAHKTLVSTVFVVFQTLPHRLRQGVSLKGFTNFATNVADKKNHTHELIYETCNRDVQWAQHAIIEKRDNVVEHWQTNTPNKFFANIIALDIPLLVYYDPKREHELDMKVVDSVLARVRLKHPKLIVDANADVLQKIAWLEAWSPTFSRQLQEDVAGLLNNDIFTALPVTPQLIKKLDETMAGLLKRALDLRQKHQTS